MGLCYLAVGLVSLAGGAGINLTVMRATSTAWLPSSSGVETGSSGATTAPMQCMDLSTPAVT